MEITITCKWADDENELIAVVPSFELAKDKLAVMERYLESKKSDLVENLTPEQEEKMKEAHASDYSGTDDDMPDAYEEWLMGLSLDEIKKLI